MRNIITWSTRGKHPWIVIAVWIVIAGALAMGPTLQSVTSNDASKSLRADRREQARRRPAAGLVRRRQGHAHHRRVQLRRAAHRRRRRRPSTRARPGSRAAPSRSTAPASSTRRTARAPWSSPAWTATRARSRSATRCSRSATTSATRVSGMQVRVTGPGGLITDVYKIFLNADVKLLIGTVILVLVLLLLIYRSPVLPFVPLITVGFGYFVAGGLLAIGANAFGDTLSGPGHLAHGHPAVRRRHRLRPAAHLALPRGAAPRARRAQGAGHGAGRDVGGHRRQRPDRDPGGAHALVRRVRRLHVVRAGARRRRLHHADRRPDAHAGHPRPARAPRLLAARAQGGRPCAARAAGKRIAERVAAAPRRSAAVVAAHPRRARHGLLLLQPTLQLHRRLPHEHALQGGLHPAREALPSRGAGADHGADQDRGGAARVRHRHDHRRSEPEPGRGRRLPHRHRPGRQAARVPGDLRG